MTDLSDRCRRYVLQNSRAERARWIELVDLACLVKSERTDRPETPDNQQTHNGLLKLVGFLSMLLVLVRIRRERRLAVGL